MNNNADYGVSSNVFDIKNQNNHLVKPYNTRQIMRKRSDNFDAR